MKLGNVLVTGANRGIGYEFVRQLLSRDDPPPFLFATYRNAKTLEDLKTLQDSTVKTKVILIKMDVTDPEEVEIARQIVEANVGEEGLHLLINNAGICEILPYCQITAEHMERHFKANAVGPVLVARAMLPFMKKAAASKDGCKVAILNIGALLGSITNTGTEFDLGILSYKMSKAALNMAMKIFATGVKDKGVLIVTMCPGWVKTDMGNKAMAELTPEESISAMLTTLEKLDETHHGAFMDRFGKISSY